MKKLVLLLSIMFATTFSFANEKVEVNSTQKDVIDPITVCRYYAITAASNDGWEYASVAWQYAYLDYYNECKDAYVE